VERCLACEAEGSPPRIVDFPRVREGSPTNSASQARQRSTGLIESPYYGANSC